MFDVIIAANGNSVRMGFDKLAAKIGENTVLARTVNAFRDIDGIERIIIVSDDAPDIGGVLTVKGGKTRELSVMEGLKATEAEYVLIHDGARPFVSKELIERVMQCTREYGSAVPCLKITDSLRGISDGYVSSFPDRNSYVTVQTPQGFRTEKLKRAFACAEKEGLLERFTDESEIYSRYVSPCKLVDGEQSNRKLTTQADFFGLNARIGTGFDIHRYVEGKPLKLCGIEIDHPYGLLAHSDGDAPLHAVTDALLTAAGERDIGVFFPDDDPRYENADSRIFLKKAAEILKEKNLSVNFLNVTIIAQSPKLSPYIEKMRQNIAALLNISPEKVTLSATTTEKLGLIGENKALAALAAAALV